MKLHVLDQKIAACLSEPAVCEACGAEFSCGAAEVAGCWCAEIELSAEARAELRRRYERCLCRACLESLSHASKKA
ncbi:MAG TPA: cysteine-rich CWC family protein [Pyrinomonadaceae bacterium]|jgi:hypothetical protein